MTLQKKRAIRLLIFTALVLSVSLSKAQIPDSIKNDLQKIYRIYDSSAYLSFNTTYSYDTDIKMGLEKHTQLDGEYTVYGHRCFYRVGSIEYLLNDSFSIAAYNDDKFLVVSRIIPTTGSSATLPVKSMLDSFFNSFFSNYNVSRNRGMVADGDTIDQISLTRKGNKKDSAMYAYLNINYDPTSYAFNSIEYGLEQPVEIEDSTVIITDTSTNLRPAPGPEQTWNVKFKIAFSNYHIEKVGTNIFSEARLINEESPGKWVGIGKYAGYTVYWSDGTKQQIVN